MKRIAAIVLSVIVFGWIVGKVLDYQYKKFWNPVFEKLDLVFKDTGKQQVVFLGDSRVHFGINPYYTDSATGLQTFNLGMGAASIYEMHLLAEVWLAKHPAPELFVVSVGHSGVLKSTAYFGNPCYYFYYLDDPLIKDALAKQHYHSSMFSIFPVLKYTAFDEYNKTSIFRSFNDALLKPGGIAYKGFINNTNNLFNLQVLNLSGKNQDTAYTDGMNEFEVLMELFKKNKCRCILVYPPTADYASMANNNPQINAIDTAIKKMAAIYNAPVLHFEKDSAFPVNMFSDEWHVNINGSILYSQKLGDSIRLFLTKKP